VLQLLRRGDAGKRIRWSDAEHWVAPPFFSVSRWRPVHGNHAIAAFLRSKHRSELGLADAYRVRQHGLKHGLQLAGRRTDDLQHLGGRRLLLQRLGEIIRALAQFIEQPRVLDGDDGLSGEVFDQLNLLVGKGANLLTAD
jgi:hypothetical protein